MIRNYLRALAGIALLFGTAGLDAQDALTLRCGSTVRIDDAQGWLVGASSDSVVMRTLEGERRTIPLAGVERVEAVRSHGSHWGKGMVLGGVIGGAAGALLGAAVAEEGSFGGSGLAALVGLVVGAGGGLVVGGVAGGLSPAERWEAVPSTALLEFAHGDGRCGPHVRVRDLAQGTAIEGVVVDVARDHIVLAPSDGRALIALPTGSGTRIEQVAGTRGHALIGGAVGLVAGGVAATQLANTTKESTGFVVAGGVLLGAMVGSAVRTPRWRPAAPDELRVGLAPHLDGLRVNVTIRF